MKYQKIINLIYGSMVDRISINVNDHEYTLVQHIAALFDIHVTANKVMLLREPERGRLVLLGDMFDRCDENLIYEVLMYGKKHKTHIIL